MSLMGYEEDQILYMMAGLNLAKHYVPSKKEGIHDSLGMIYDFFDQLLMEGRV